MHIVGRFGRAPLRAAAYTLVVSLFGACLSTAATAATPVPRIVNGYTTFDYPATGLLLIYDYPGQPAPTAFCSGILIGCRTFLTAAHCVCPDAAYDYASCTGQGIIAADRMSVWLQHGGSLAVSGSAIPPNYSFAVAGDLALVTLAQPVTAIPPAPINTAYRPPSGSPGTIVGFGTTGGASQPDDAGIKRQGQMISGTCPADLPANAHICWDFEGTGASTCEGDSGGPLLMDLGQGLVVAGITSGGSSTNCTPPDLPFDTDVYVARQWITTHANGDLGTAACGSSAPVGQSPTEVVELSGSLSSLRPDFEQQISVPAGTQELRVTLNSQFASGVGMSSVDNDFDLYVAAGTSVSTTHYDCRDTNSSGFGTCIIAAPAAGTWSVLVHDKVGSGAFQATVSKLLAPSVTCTGDCNQDGEVTVDELVTGVNIALETANVSVCPAMDANGDGTVTVDELVVAVNLALTGCPS